MPVYGPCPNSMCLQITVTVLSGAMRMNALGTNSAAGLGRAERALRQQECGSRR